MADGYFGRRGSAYGSPSTTPLPTAPAQGQLIRWEEGRSFGFVAVDPRMTGGGPSEFFVHGSELCRDLRTRLSNLSLASASTFLYAPFLVRGSNSRLVQPIPVEIGAFEKDRQDRIQASRVRCIECLAAEGRTSAKAAARMAPDKLKTVTFQDTGGRYFKCDDCGYNNRMGNQPYKEQYLKGQPVEIICEGSCCGKGTVQKAA